MRVAEVDVLINGQALSTQAQRVALTHFATCPFFSLLMLIQLFTSLRALAEFSSRSRTSKFHRSCPFLLEYTICFYDGAIFAQLCFVIHDPNSTWKQPTISTENIIIRPPFVATPKSDKTCVTQLILGTTGALVKLRVLVLY